MRNFFTLIELIVVIAVLGILAAIIIPNISSFQEEANTTAIVNNVRNLQTGVDMYGFDNYGNVPTYGTPTEYEPKPINFEEMHPDYTRDLPETPGVKYWVDGWGKVWASSVDAPKNVELNSTQLKWETVPEADMYKVYKVLNPTNTSSLLNANTKLVFYKEASKDEYSGLTVDDENIKYAVSAVDQNKFESAPAGSSYEGYQKTIDTYIQNNPVETSPENVSSNSIKVDLNQFNKIIYVDGINGSDTTGNGSESLPYKTISKALNNSVQNTGIVLKKGTYSADNLSFSNDISLIGYGKETVLTTNGGKASWYGTEKHLKLYNLYLNKFGEQFSTSDVNTFNSFSIVDLHNVVMKDNGYISNSSQVVVNGYNSVFINTQGGYGFFGDLNNGGEFKNSVFIGKNRWSISTGGTYYYNIGDTDSNLSSGSGSNNQIISTITIDSEFKLTILDSYWVDKGDGNDRDNSIADIGVYGGQYGW